MIVRLIKGYTCSEIQAEIGVGPKVIDNARTRVKAKLRRLLGEYGSLLSPDVPTEVRRREDLYLDLPIQSEKHAAVLFSSRLWYNRRG